jgi:hypothetical protein
MRWVQILKSRDAVCAERSCRDKAAKRIGAMRRDHFRAGACFRGACIEAQSMIRKSA